MLLPQQSAAFNILRTRLKTVPSNAFNTDQLKRISSGNPYSQILQISEDVNKNQDLGNMHNAINFASRLQQFEHMQNQHRMHAKLQQQSRNSTPSTLSQEMQKSEESRRPSPIPDMTRPPSRSSWSSGQFQH